MDASGPDGAGGLLYNSHRSRPHQLFHLPWPDGWASGNTGASSTFQELATINLILDSLLREGHKQLTIWTDSGASVDAVARGSSPVPTVNRTVQAILSLTAVHGAVLLLCWHSRESGAGRAADLLSHGVAQGIGPVLEPSSTSRRQVRWQDLEIYSKRPSDTSTTL